MTIGSWGNVLVFSTSDTRILTFQKFSRSVGSEWAAHSRIGKKDMTEFVKPSLQKVTFTIDLDATLGVKPRAMIEAIEDAIETGTVNTLVIGAKKVGKNRWKIKSMSDDWGYILPSGELLRAKVSITMEEYL